MNVLIKLAYGAAVAALMVLLVAFGIQAFYDGPEPPRPPEPPFARGPLTAPPVTGPGLATPTVATPSPQEIERYEREQREFQQAYEKYQEQRGDYHRNVFLVAATLAVLAIVGGVGVWSRVDAMSLGFIAGGFASLVYGIIQAGGDLDEASPALIFAFVLVGLALVLGAGYRWLSIRPG